MGRGTCHGDDFMTRSRDRLLMNNSLPELSIMISFTAVACVLIFSVSGEVETS